MLFSITTLTTGIIGVHGSYLGQLEMLGVVRVFRCRDEMRWAFGLVGACGKPGVMEGPGAQMCGATLAIRWADSWQEPTQDLEPWGYLGLLEPSSLGCTQSLKPVTGVWGRVERGPGVQGCQMSPYLSHENHGPFVRESPLGPWKPAERALGLVFQEPPGTPAMEGALGPTISLEPRHQMGGWGLGSWEPQAVTLGCGSQLVQGH